MKWGHRKLLATNAISRSSRGLIGPSQSWPLMAVVVRFRWCVFFSLLFRRLPAVSPQSESVVRLAAQSAHRRGTNYQTLSLIARQPTLFGWEIKYNKQTTKINC